MSRKRRGDGTVYLRGPTWWIQYSYRGKVKRESSGSQTENVAVKLLRRRLGEASRGRIIGPVAEKVTLGDMKEALLTDYRLRGNRSVVTAQYCARSLVAYFDEKTLALDITSDRIASYVEARQKEGAANATINRETAALRRMFHIMVEVGKLSRDHVPARPCLEEAAPRRGFLEPNDFARLREALPGHLREPASFLYVTGWRKGAMRSLQWLRDCELDFDDDGVLVGGAVTLQAEFSKNKQAYTLPLKGELLEVIRRAWANRKAECPYVFHKAGQAIGDFRKAWAAACTTASLGSVLIHDMRRSCARNLVRSGVSERVAMAVTGHRTRSMFDRYNIVAGSDLESAIERVSEYVAAKENDPVRGKVVQLQPRKVA
jgi:integrase